MILSTTHCQHINQYISNIIGEEFIATRIKSVAGGDINASYTFIDETNDKHFFVKINKQEFINLFTSEVEGLTAISKTNTLQIPDVIGCDTYENIAFLVLSFVDIRRSGNAYALGQQLAQLHQCTDSQFGFDQDNFIGTTYQSNKRKSNWFDFWVSERLEPQLALAYDSGHQATLKKPSERLLKQLPGLLASHQPQASLVHGDLWSGNKGFMADGTPLIFDPACYYGDREVDIAMTRLFSGFDADFYEGYNATWPLAEDAPQREHIYHLYHLLNHLNLFGASYLSNCVTTIEKILRSQ